MDKLTTALSALPATTEGEVPNGYLGTVRSLLTTHPTPISSTGLGPYLVL